MNKYIIIGIIVLILGIIIAIPKVRIPNPVKLSKKDDTFDAFNFAQNLYNQMRGIDWFRGFTYNFYDMLVNLNSLTDRQLIDVNNEFNKNFYNKKYGKLYQWIKDELALRISTSAIKETVLKRMENLNLQ